MQPLPTWQLPSKFNKTIKAISKYGFEDGILTSKINQDQDGSELNTFVGDRLSKFYQQKPLTSGSIIGIVVTFSLISIFFLIFGFDLLQSRFLIGNSYVPLLIYSGLLCIFGLIFVLYKWSKPSKRGAKMINQVKGYKYYLESAEKLKLDFSNNPTDGVQYYLKSVAYAASFGILDKFNKYFTGLIPNTNELNITDSLLINYGAVSFYTPPSNIDAGGIGGSFGGSVGGGGSW